MNNQKPKKQYRSPQLKKYGSVKVLTKGGGGPSTDARGTKVHRQHPRR